MDPELKKAVEELGSQWAEFKKTNDDRLKKLEAHQGGTGDLDAKLERLEKEIKANQDIIAKFGAMANRGRISGAGGEPDAAQEEHKKAFQNWIRKGTDAGLADLEKKAGLISGVDANGGYLVPKPMEQQIITLLSPAVAMRRLANVVTIGTDALRLPAATGATAGGWVGESDDRPQTDATTFATVEIPAHEVYAQPAASQAFLDDAFGDPEAFIGEEIARTLQSLEGNAFILGNGTKKPTGICIAANTVANANWTWGKLGVMTTGDADGFAATDPGDSIVDLVSSLKAGYRPGAAFLMNDTTAAMVRKFKSSAPNGGYLWEPSFQAGQPARLLGYPVETDDNMPGVAADALAIAFGNFKAGYQIVDRVGIRMLRDPLTKKGFVLFYTTKRVGGGVRNWEAIKLLKVAV